MSRYLHTLLKAINVVVPPGLVNPEIKNLSCDSREIEKGDLFIGLDGEKVIAPSLLTEGKVYQKAQQLGMGK